MRLLPFSLTRLIALAALAAGLCVAASVPTPAQTDDSAPPYEARMLRLAEILGAMHYLVSICEPETEAAKTGRWRTMMTNLIEATQPDRKRRQLYVDRFNRGYGGFAQLHRQCTPSARLAMQRYRKEGRELVHEITSRHSR